MNYLLSFEVSIIVENAQKNLKVSLFDYFGLNWALLLNYRSKSLVQMQFNLEFSTEAPDKNINTNFRFLTWI